MHEQLEVQSKASQAEMEQQQQQLFRFTEGLAQRQQKRKAEYIEAQASCQTAEDLLWSCAGRMAEETSLCRVNSCSRPLRENWMQT